MKKTKNRQLLVRFTLSQALNGKKAFKTEVFLAGQKAFKVPLSFDVGQALDGIDKFLQASKVGNTVFNTIAISANGYKESLLHRQLETFHQTISFLDSQPF